MIIVSTNNQATTIELKRRHILLIKATTSPYSRLLFDQIIPASTPVSHPNRLLFNFEFKQFQGLQSQHTTLATNNSFEEFEHLILPSHDNLQDTHRFIVGQMME